MTTIEMGAIVAVLSFCVGWTMATVIIQVYEWTWRERGARINRHERLK